MGLMSYPTSQNMLEKKRRPLHGGGLSRRWWVSESEQKGPPHGWGLGLKAEASFRSGSWLGREADTESARPGLGSPSGARGHRCLEMQQGCVRSSLQSWGRGTQTHHEEPLRKSPPLPTRPMLIERNQRAPLGNRSEEQRLEMGIGNCAHLGPITQFTIAHPSCSSQRTFQGSLQPARL